MAKILDVPNKKIFGWHRFFFLFQEKLKNMKKLILSLCLGTMSFAVYAAAGTEVKAESDKVEGRLVVQAINRSLDDDYGVYCVSRTRTYLFDDVSVTATCLKCGSTSAEASAAAAACVADKARAMIISRLL